MGSNTRRILVADDEQSVRRLIATVLEGDGYQVLMASGGYEALNLALANPVDLFLLDIGMPQIDGIEVCRKIRSLPTYGHTPVLFVTGASYRELQAAAFEAGCDDFLNKPIDTLVLRARVRGHIRRVEYFDQLQRTRQTLQHYVSRRTLEMVETAARTGIVPVPEERDVAVCFTDIRGFTALAEEVDAAMLFNQISARLARQVDLVYEYGGYIDKFGGDGIMAVFDKKDRVRQSCLCALRIIETAEALDGNERIGQLGIGIHCGRAVIGNIGSPEHLDYSAIGTTINLAARLCGHAQPMSVVVSKAVRDTVYDDSRLHFHSERQVPIRGLRDPVTVYLLTL